MSGHGASDEFFDLTGFSRTLHTPDRAVRRHYRAADPWWATPSIRTNLSSRNCPILKIRFPNLDFLTVVNVWPPTSHWWSLQKCHGRRILLIHRCENDDCGIIVCASRSRQIRDVAAQESPGDRVPVFGAFDSSDPVARGTHVFHRKLYFPSRDYWRRLGRPDCCYRIRVLQPLPRIFS